MPTNRARDQLWHTTPSGVVVPAGTSPALDVSSTRTYLQIKEKAKAVEQLYRDNSVSLLPESALANLISDAKTLSDAWLTNNTHVATMQLMFRVCALDRIADAILPLSAVPDRRKYLKNLTDGTLDLQQRERSMAKDILWELELWSTLHSRSVDAILHEPPDIVVNFEDAKVGIACKKLYSENNVEKVLSEGVGQIESSYDFGILAVNLDDLILPDQILRVPTQNAMGKFLGNLNLKFLETHKRHFKKYLGSGRVISALVSTSVIAEITKETPTFNIGTQKTIWSIPGLAPEKEKQLKRLYAQVMEPSHEVSPVTTRVTPVTRQALHEGHSGKD